MYFSEALSICTEARILGHAATVGFDPMAHTYYAVVRLAGKTLFFTQRSEWSETAPHGTAA
jgi:hypothetical protein